jgi:hypothetical protein
VSANALAMPSGVGVDSELMPFWSEVNESKPMWTRTGRYENYRTEPEAIEYGENFISHREA